MMALASGAGTVGMIGTTFNDKIDEFTKNNKGVGPNNKEMALMAVAATGEMLLEKLAFDKAWG